MKGSLSLAIKRSGTWKKTAQEMLFYGSQETCCSLHNVHGRHRRHRCNIIRAVSGNWEEAIFSWEVLKWKLLVQEIDSESQLLWPAIDRFHPKHALDWLRFCKCFAPPVLQKLLARRGPVARCAQSAARRLGALVMFHRQWNKGTCRTDLYF